MERLTERQIAVQKVVNALGEAPTGLKDVFEICRGFERAFAAIIQVWPDYCLHSEVAHHY